MLQTVCIRDKREVISVHSDEPLDDVDLLYALLHGVLVLPIAAKIRGPELNRYKLNFIRSFICEYDYFQTLTIVPDHPLSPP